MTPQGSAGRLRLSLKGWGAFGIQNSSSGLRDRDVRGEHPMRPSRSGKGGRFVGVEWIILPAFRDRDPFSSSGPGMQWAHGSCPAFY